MTAQLLPSIVVRAVDANGNAISGAKLYFYVTGTTTPASTYTSSTLGTPNANPVVADSGGLFTPIYLDPAVTYRAILKTSGGSAIQDIDPIAFPSANEASEAQVTAGTATDVFISPRRAGTGGVNLIGYTPVNKAGDTATGLNITRATTPAANAAGFLGLPVTTLDSTSSLTKAMQGGMVRHTSGSAHTWTLPTTATAGWVIGSTLNLRNYGAGVVTVSRAGGVSIRSAGSGTDADKSLAQYAWATLTMEDTDVWVVSGSGVS